MIRMLGLVTLRWVAALVGITLGWAAAAALLSFVTGWSADSYVMAVWIGFFCLAAWLLIGLPLAVLNPDFATASPAVAAIMLTGVTGAGMVTICLWPHWSAGPGAGLFLLGGFIAGSVAMAGYVTLSRLIARRIGGARASTGGWAIGRLIPVLLGGGALAGIIALPLGFAASRIVESRRTVTVSMTWQPLAEGDSPSSNGVLLRFTDHPGHYLVEYMPGLLDHLHTSGKRTIPVEFLAYSDFRGRLKGYAIVRIDGMPYRPDPLGRGRAGEEGTASIGQSRHPLDLFR